MTPRQPLHYKPSMPALRVKCPHCREILEIGEERFGAPSTCPACGGAFKVPLPPRIPAAPRRSLRTSNVASACPRCKADLAPGTAVCPNCLTQVATGKRLPLRQRIKRLSVRTWMTALLALVGGVVIVAGIIEWRGRLRPRPNLDSIGADKQPGELPERAVVRALFAARDGAARRAAYDELLRLGGAAHEALAAALRVTDRPAADAEITRSTAAALDLLGRSGESRYLNVVQPLVSAEPLKDAVLRARGMLGDAGVAAAVVGRWSEQLRRRLFLDRLAALTGTRNPAFAAMRDRAQREAEDWAGAVRRLAASSNSRVVEYMLDGDWNSWGWLGQSRDERYIGELWDAARPSNDQDLRQEARIRALRDVLDRSADHGSLSRCAAAGLVLGQCVPQDQALRKDAVNRIASRIPGSTPLEQQRGAWALGRLAGQNIAGITANSSPSDLAATDIAIVVGWAGSVGIGETSGFLVSDAAAYPRPPIVERRIITPTRQHEAALLDDLARDWPSALRAVTEWQGTELGFTPRLAALLDPRQHDPRYPALAGAMCLSVALDARNTRESLRRWAESRAQPGWVRGLAYTALAGLAARGGDSTPGWPGGLTEEMLGDLDLGPPGLAAWAELLALGGDSMLNKLRTEELAIPEAIRARLIFAGEQALRRRRAAVAAP